MVWRLRALVRIKCGACSEPIEPGQLVQWTAEGDWVHTGETPRAPQPTQCPHHFIELPCWRCE